MTKEQEVIEYFKKQIEICNENADICDKNDFDEEATYLRKQQYMFETALNMIKEKDRKINSKNGTINALQCALKERTEERDRKDDIVTKQNKILDLMTECSVICGLERLLDYLAEKHICYARFKNTTIIYKGKKGKVENFYIRRSKE